MDAHSQSVGVVPLAIKYRARGTAKFSMADLLPVNASHAVAASAMEATMLAGVDGQCLPARVLGSYEPKKNHIGRPSCSGTSPNHRHANRAAYS